MLLTHARSRFVYMSERKLCMFRGVAISKPSYEFRKSRGIPVAATFDDDYRPATSRCIHAYFSFT
jgi:hypothetical protein